MCIIGNASSYFIPLKFKRIQNSYKWSSLKASLSFYNLLFVIKAFIRIWNSNNLLQTK